MQLIKCLRTSTPALLAESLHLTDCSPSKSLVL
jgi:hypothetical protein